MTEPEQPSTVPSPAPESSPAPVTADTRAGKKAARKAKQATRRRTARGTILIGLAFVAGFIILGIIAIQVWDYSNSVAFCTQVCHKVHPEESEAFLDSYHADIKCTECHMGRVNTLRGIVLKAGHFRHLPDMLLNRYERPLVSSTMRPANESCEKCHWPPAFHGDRVVTIADFLPDEANTQKTTYQIMHTGAGARTGAAAFGIHWHIGSPVEYIATDANKQDIRWVRVTFPDGRTVEYNDITNPLSVDEIARADKKTMDCVDCHNRVGHPFSSPETLIDQALLEGRIDKKVPYLKAELLSTLSAPYASRDAALAAVDGLKQQYAADHPDAAAQLSAQLDQATQVGKELVPRLIFEQEGVTWKSFNDNGKHTAFPGCLRCHDGKHLSADGEAIRLHCNICHGVPATVGADARIPQLPVAVVQEPATHLDTTFVADHRFLANDECATCHGDTHFGNDDSGFCANSSCHGRAWPSVNLDAAFPHPIPLTGKHAQVLCSACHKGETKPEYKCSDCHQPPQATHFGNECEQCHTPDGFDKATLSNFTHPIPLVGRHAALQCTDCHSGGATLTYTCSACHQPPADHFQQSCDTCHTPVGWAESVAGLVQSAPQVPHTLSMRGNCLACHNPAGNVVPAPENHTSYTNDQCLLCHKVAP